MIVFTSVIAIGIILSAFLLALLWSVDYIDRVKPLAADYGERPYYSVLPLNPEVIQAARIDRGDLIREENDTPTFTSTPTEQVVTLTETAIFTKAPATPSVSPTKSGGDTPSSTPVVSSSPTMTLTPTPTDTVWVTLAPSSTPQPTNPRPTRPNPTNTQPVGTATTRPTNVAPTPTQPPPPTAPPPTSPPPTSPPPTQPPPPTRTRDPYPPQPTTYP